MAVHQLAKTVQIEYTTSIDQIHTQREADYNVNPFWQKMVSKPVSAKETGKNIYCK